MLAPLPRDTQRIPQKSEGVKTARLLGVCSTGGGLVATNTSPELVARRPTVRESRSQTVHVTASWAVRTVGVVRSDPGSAGGWPRVDQPGPATWSRQDQPPSRPHRGVLALRHRLRKKWPDVRLTCTRPEGGDETRGRHNDYMRPDCSFYFPSMLASSLRASSFAASSEAGNSGLFGRVSKWLRCSRAFG